LPLDKLHLNVRQVGNFGLGSPYIFTLNKLLVFVSIGYWLGVRKDFA